MRCFLAALIFLVFVFSAETIASTQLELFGVSIKGASRDQLRQAFKDGNLRVIREDKSYWVDTYDAKGVLDGASEFTAGYVAASDKFAFAQYKFSAFMDSKLVVRVIDMVSAKYGKPTSRSGSYELGEVNVKWNFPNGMRIEVSRGWPDSTTYLMFVDSAAYMKMRAEIDANKKAETSQRARAQGHAF